MTGSTTSGQASLPSVNPTKSYWHRDPSKVLLGHRTTPSLPDKADLVIIGSGISGSSAAHYLRENEQGKDLNVVMLEAREACFGATGRNGGHCQPIVYNTTPDIGAFEYRNYETIKSLIEKHNIPCDWKSTSGCHAYMNSDMFKVALSGVKELKRADPELAKRVKVITKESRSPSLLDLRIPTAAGAILIEHAASLWPYKLVAWILENLLSSNTAQEVKFNLQTNTPVTHLQQKEPGLWIVHTARGMIATPKILLATNGYTSHLIPSFSDLIVPVRGEMSALLPPASMRPANTKHQPLQYTYGFVGHGIANIEQDDYLVQRPFVRDNRGELMFGGGRAYAAASGVGVSDDSSIDPPAAAYLRRELNIVLDLQNDDHELEATYEWSGIMGYSRDGHPWVGELSEDIGLGGGKGLWVCAGFTGHGMPNTHLSAKAVVDMVLGEDVYLPASYKLSRERVVKARSMYEVAVADAAA